MKKIYSSSFAKNILLSATLVLAVAGTSKAALTYDIRATAGTNGASLGGGGKTVGVIPQALVDIEFADHDNDELHVVETMGQRKHMITDISDAFITLPGGAGTLEEFFEIWVGHYLKFHTKPVVILDPFGIYAPLHELILHLEEEKFIKPGMRDIVQWTTNVDDALKACGA